MIILKCIPFFDDEISWFEIINLSLIPVILFLAGFLLNKLIENLKEKKSYDLYEKYFFGLIKQLIKKNKNQIKLLKEAAARQVDFDSKNLMTELASGESHLLLKDIDRSKFYYGFVLNKKKKFDERATMFEKLITKIDYLYKLHVNLEKNNLTIPPLTDKYSKIWNDSQISLNTELNRLKQEANQKGLKISFLFEVEKLQVKVTTIKKDNVYMDNIETGFNIYVKPLISILIKSPKDPWTPTLMDYTQKAKFAYQMLKVERDKNKEYFEDLANKFKDENNELSLVLDEYNKG